MHASLELGLSAGEPATLQVRWTTCQPVTSHTYQQFFYNRGLTCHISSLQLLMQDHLLTAMGAALLACSVLRSTACLQLCAQHRLLVALCAALSAYSLSEQRYVTKLLASPGLPCALTANFRVVVGGCCRSLQHPLPLGW